MQQWHGLHWTCESPSLSINFMDLTISVINGCLESTLYEKPQNLYLHLPPHSSHPSGIEWGLIFGQLLRIRCLCSSTTDATTCIRNLFQRLVTRGHVPMKLIPIFSHAEENATHFLKRLQTDPVDQLPINSNPDRLLFFHLGYHPNGPPLD